MGSSVAKFRKKPVLIEAITFDELIEHGRTCEDSCRLVNGMPWHFTYQGQVITHERDDCYLIPTLEGIAPFHPGEMLITGVKGELYPCKGEIFALTYEAVEDRPSPKLTKEQVRLYGSFTEANGYTVQAAAEMFIPKK
jgi:hypothetical protein